MDSRAPLIAINGLLEEKSAGDRLSLPLRYAERVRDAGGVPVAVPPIGDKRDLLALMDFVDAVVQNQDNREHDLLDSDDYYQFEGGMTATVRVLSGQQPSVYHNDHSLPFRPKIRTLEDEVARVVRARVVNPKWISGVMRHGYKGAFEMAATVDYLFAFAATAQCVSDHHFDAVFDAYVMDDEVRQFFERYNPAALAEMASRLKEAQDRELWRPRSNLSYRMLEMLANEASPSLIEGETVL